MLKHIASKGLSKGQWVNCDAKIMCRNSSQKSHITAQEYGAVKEWMQDQGLGKKVTQQEIDNFRERYQGQVLTYRLSKVPKEDIERLNISWAQWPEKRKTTTPRGREITMYSGPDVNQLINLIKDSQNEKVRVRATWRDGKKGYLEGAALQHIYEKFAESGVFSDIFELDIIGDRKELARIVDKKYKL